MGEKSQVHETLTILTSDIVAAHISHNRVSGDQLPDLIQRIFEALSGLGAPAIEDTARPTPAVSIRTSVKPDHLICLECGKPMKLLKRHLDSEHGLSVADYRERWDLPSHYPMVAPAYAQRRSELARQIGLGGRKADKSAEPMLEIAGTAHKPKRAKLTLWRDAEKDAPLAQTDTVGTAATQAPSTPEALSEKVLIEAIARQRVIAAIYNGGEMHLAPHQLFSRHGETFVSALNTRKTWRSDDERRLGHFKVSGLTNIALTQDAFLPLPGFDDSLPREGDVPLFAVSA